MVVIQPNNKRPLFCKGLSDCRQTPKILEFAYSLFSFKIEVTRGRVDFRYERTLSAGTASAASLAALSPGSSARAVPAGVAVLRSNQRGLLKNE